MRVLVLALLLTISAGVVAQNKFQQTQKVFKLTFLEPGVGMEFPLGKSTTLLTRVGLTATLAERIDINDFSEHFTFLFRGFFSASGRYYYNFEKRKLMGKNNERNSANYMALLFLAATKPVNKNNAYAYESRYHNVLINTGFVWGLQRNYPSHFSLDLNIGLGYTQAGHSWRQFSPIGEFNIGFWLGRK
jgi:hypothetical protein